jgi:hypothetical protein
VWSTWKVDVAFARVAVADGRQAGVPDAPRRATHGLAEAPQAPAIPKKPEESGPMILIAMPPSNSIDRPRPHPVREQLRTSAWRSGGVLGSGDRVVALVGQPLTSAPHPPLARPDPPVHPIGLVAVQRCLEPAEGARAVHGDLQVLTSPGVGDPRGTKR